MIQTLYYYTDCHSYLDVLNMLQPLYVFIIFVLKKNVIDVILGRDKKKTISKTTKSKQSNTRNKNIVKTRYNEINDRTSESTSVSLQRETVSTVMQTSPELLEEIPLKSLT